MRPPGARRSAGREQPRHEPDEDDHADELHERPGRDDDASIVRESIALDELDAADRVPTLDALTLDLDHYGRLVGIRVAGSPDSVLPPALLDAARAG